MLMIGLLTYTLLDYKGISDIIKIMRKHRVKEIAISNRDEVEQELMEQGEVSIMGIVTLRKKTKGPFMVYDGLNKKYVEKPEYETITATPSLGLKKRVLTN